MGAKSRRELSDAERRAWQMLRDYARKDNARGAELASAADDLLRDDGASAPDASAPDA